MATGDEKRGRHVFETQRAKPRWDNFLQLRSLQRGKKGLISSRWQGVGREEEVLMRSALPLLSWHRDLASDISGAGVWCRR